MDQAVCLFDAPMAAGETVTVTLAVHDIEEAAREARPLQLYLQVGCLPDYAVTCEERDGTNHKTWLDLE